MSESGGDPGRAGVAPATPSPKDPTLRAELGQVHAVLDATLEGIAMVDAAGGIQHVNPALCALFGYEAAELEGQPAGMLVLPREWDLPQPESAGEPADSSWVCERVGRRREGTPFPLRISLARVRGSGEGLFVALFRDLSEARQLRQELLAAGRAAALAEDRERRRLAAELHDDLGQLLALSAMELAALRDALPEALRPRLSEIEARLHEAGARTESLSAQLSPPVLHERGLVPAAEWLGRDLKDRYRLRVRLEDDGAPKPLGEASRVVLFRALRELLINVARHAGTDRADVRIERVSEAASDRVRITVSDEGLGFDPRPGAKGLGLIFARERLRELGGRLTVDSQPDAGTRVVLEAPLDEDA